MKRQLFFLAALLPFISCHKDTDTVISVTETPDPPEVYITTRLATVIDTFSPDMENAFQDFAGIDKSFDDIPFLMTRGHLVRRDRELIRLHAYDNDFFKVISLVENDVNYTDWSIPALHSNSGQGAMNSNFDFSTTGTLFIPANTLTDADGNLYQGTYSVSWSVFNPESADTKFIPSYTAVISEGQLAQLLPEFCFYISVKANNGSPLKFNSGAYFKPNTTNEASWFFDTDLAAWISQGTESQIDISGNGYYMVGGDVPQARVTGTLLINGLPTPHYAVTIEYMNQVRQFYTTNTGSWAILLPSGTSCVATVKLPCGTEKQVSFEVSNDATSIIPLSIDAPDVTNAFIKGTVRGCEAEMVEDPLLVIGGSAEQFFYPSSAGIDLYYPSCIGSKVLIQAIDSENQDSGPVISWETGDTIDIRSAFTCNAARNEYLFLTVAGDQKMYWDMSSALTSQDRVLIETGINEMDVEFQIYISGDEAGDYEDTKLNILFEDMQLGSRGFSLNCPTATSGCGFTKFTITHFPEASGQWIRGYFQGKFWIKTFQPLTAGYRDVTGEFQVYREF